jgi:hypothetical protein
VVAPSRGTFGGKVALVSSDPKRHYLSEQGYPWVYGVGCPLCGGSLFLGMGGYITCSYERCPDPGAAAKAIREAGRTAKPTGQSPHD